MNLKKIEKNYNCVIEYRQSLYSNKAEIEMYGTNYDLQLAMLGIILTYIERGNDIEDIKEIIKKIETNGNGVF